MNDLMELDKTAAPVENVRPGAADPQLACAAVGLAAQGLLHGLLAAGEDSGYDAPAGEAMESSPMTRANLDAASVLAQGAGPWENGAPCALGEALAVMESLHEETEPVSVVAGRLQELSWRLLAMAAGAAPFDRGPAHGPGKEQGEGDEGSLP